MRTINTKQIWLGLLLLLSMLPEAVLGQVIISTTSTHTESLDETSLNTPSEAGEDLLNIVETLSNFNQLSIKNVKKSQQWKVAVSRRDINWPAAFSIYIRRNSNGTPCSGCTGINTGLSPTIYVPINLLESDFIYGNGEVGNIDVQVKVEGISLTVDAQAYSTEIIYTLYGD